MNLVREIIEKGEVEFEGVTLQYLAGTPAPGDIYLAERNNGPKLLTCSFVDMGAVFPEEKAYPYDLHECVRVDIKE